MLFDLHSGALLADTLDFLKKECSDKESLESYKLLVTGLTERYDKQVGQYQEGPVVKPTQVFPNNPF
tara:strand:+ start:173 stop:373 length:201 start_codon:yes stop_codon:yes gene_type:complete